MIAVGAGSLAYHGGLTFAGQLLDVQGMYLIAVLLLVGSCRRTALAERAPPIALALLVPPRCCPMGSARQPPVALRGRVAARDRRGSAASAGLVTAARCGRAATLGYAARPADERGLWRDPGFAPTGACRVGIPRDGGVGLPHGAALSVGGGAGRDDDECERYCRDIELDATGVVPMASKAGAGRTQISPRVDEPRGRSEGPEVDLVAVVVVRSAMLRALTEEREQDDPARHDDVTQFRVDGRALGLRTRCRSCSIHGQTSNSASRPRG